MENKAHALAAGAFVLVLSALLIALAFWLTRETGVRQIYEVSTRETVTGLQPQATVRYRGINVGKVSFMGYDQQIPGNVLVRIAIDENTPVTRSTFASLGFQGVTGIAFVQLDDTGASTEKLATSSDHPGRIPMHSGLVDQLAGQSTRLLAQLEETSRRVNQLLAPENQKALMAGINLLGQAAASVPPAMTQVTTTFKSMGDTSVSVASSADEVKKTAVEFNGLSKRLQRPDGLLDQFANGAGAMASNGQALQADTLPRINRAVDDTGRAARQMGRAASLLNDNPQVLFFGGPPLPPGPGEPGFVPPSAKP
jgi:phospholipid/cholesterol/gamma-HCH transport system substrate-binding protein